MVSPSVKVGKLPIESEILPWRMQILFEKVDKYREMLAEKHQTLCLHCNKPCGDDPDFCSLECAMRY